MLSKYYKTEDVKAAVIGNWETVIRALVPETEPALHKIGRHITCPFHGGEKDFRFDTRKFHDHGSAWCTCGKWPTGFDLLMFARGWTFQEARDAVGELLSVTKRDYTPSDSKRSIPNHHKQATKPSGANHTVVKESSRSPADVSPAKGISGVVHFSDGTPRPVSLALVKAQQAKAGFSVGERPSVIHLPGPVSEERVPVDTLQPAVSASPKPALVQSQPTVPAMTAPSIPKTSSYEDQRTDEDRLNSLGKTWDECVSMFDQKAKPGILYLSKRGINPTRLRRLDNDIRFHPDLMYYYDVGNPEESIPKKLQDMKFPKKGFPAIVCAIRNVHGEIIGLHRTYLTHRTGVKAPVLNNKKRTEAIHSLSSEGMAIRLGYPVDGILGVSEGLETALSPTTVYGIPTWPCINDSGLANFIPPIPVRLLIIWADKDRSNAGWKAAVKLKERMEAKGIACMILIPPLPIPKAGKAKGVDWNDVLVRSGGFAFPFAASLLKEYYEKPLIDLGYRSA